MPDKLTALNIRVGLPLPARCPACRAYSIHYGTASIPNENERAVGWSFREGVFCTNKCGVVGKLISDNVITDSGTYELYAPESLIPMLVARKLRGELGSAKAGLGPFILRKTLTEYQEESTLRGRLKFDASLITPPFRLPPTT